MKCISTDDASTREWPMGADEDRRNVEGRVGPQKPRCFQKEGEQGLLEYRTRWELRNRWVRGLEGGSESLVGGEETGRMKGLSKKLGCEGRGQRLRTERREKNQIKALFSKF